MKQFIPYEEKSGDKYTNSEGKQRVMDGRHNG